MPRLFILSGPDLGQIHSFTEKVRLGRAPSCEVVVRGASISRAHAELSPEGVAWSAFGRVDVVVGDLAQFMW